MILAILTTVVILALTIATISLARNLQAARRSGLPYTIVPRSSVNILSPTWFAFAPTVLAILGYLPKSWTAGLVPLIDFSRLWHNTYHPFERLNCDAFMTVSPSGNVLWTRDPQTILQLSKTCHNPDAMKNAFNVYGPNIAGTRGREWQSYRKVLAPVFSENLHARVWETALNQTESMLNTWQPLGEGLLVPHIRRDVEDLMLHVASEVFFGQKCEWNDKDQTITSSFVNNRKQHEHHHVMDYDTAMKSMLQNIFKIFFWPNRILKCIPLSSFRLAALSFDEWGRYMCEIRDRRLKARKEGQMQNAPLDLLDALVEAASGSHAESSMENKVRKKGQIHPDAVTGNMFFCLLAGHETSANILAFALLALAIRKGVQEAVRNDIDKILGNKSHETWTYRGDCCALLDGYVGAVIYETLRIWPSLPALAKMSPPQEQVLSINGQTHIIPPSTFALLHASAAQMSPQKWERPEISVMHTSQDSWPFPLSHFEPSRWLQETHTSTETITRATDVAETWIDEMQPEQATARRRLKPIEPGTFLPFSEGQSACLGSRMALTELCAAISFICQRWTINVAVKDDKGGFKSNKQADKHEIDRTLAETAQILSSLVEFHVVVQTTKPIAVELIPIDRAEHDNRSSAQ